MSLLLQVMWLYTSWIELDVTRIHSNFIGERFDLNFRFRDTIHPGLPRAILVPGSLFMSCPGPSLGDCEPALKPANHNDDKSFTAFQLVDSSGALDQSSAIMCTKLLSAYDDLYNPDSSQILINSIRSFINSKLDHERKIPEFISEIRRRLYFLHEYNCQVAKVTCTYPRTRKFDSLLIKYIELEFEVLYNNPYFSRQIEITTELRILRLLQVMLYPAVLNNEPLINLHTDRILKKAVLQLLGEVRSRYLVENKLVCNIANKILKKINGNNSFNFSKTSNGEVQKNLATSDYGTDSESDVESYFPRAPEGIESSVRSEKRSAPVSDCVEVPLTTDDIAPIPTVEFVDEDNYFVYLQKGLSTKRKNEDDGKTVSTKRTSSHLHRKKQFPLKTSTKVESSAPCVSLCSDSEDETPESSCKTKENVSRTNGVVTFEILDDDEDDDKSKVNYMVYLQKEVKTREKTKQKPIKQEAIIICSDSEDESGIATSVSEAEPMEKPESPSSQGSPDPTHEFETEIKIEETIISKSEDDDSGKKINLDASSSHSKERAASNAGGGDTPARMETTEKASDAGSAREYPALDPSDLLMLDNEAGPSINDNFLIDPSVIFQPTAQTEETCRKNVSGGDQGDFGCNILGGQFFGEKAAADNSQECRINESFLDELLFDDNYLFQGQKEFEELESFLFNDSTEKQGFYSSNFSFDDNDNVLQPETFDADMKSLDSLLHNSQLFNVTDSRNQVNAQDQLTKTQFSVSVIKNPNSVEYLNNGRKIDLVRNCKR